MIQAESDPDKRNEYLQRLMELPNQVRSYLITEFSGRMPVPVVQLDASFFVIGSYNACLEWDVANAYFIAEMG